MHRNARLPDRRRDVRRGRDSSSGAPTAGRFFSPTLKVCPTMAETIACIDVDLKGRAEMTQTPSRARLFRRRSAEFRPSYG